MRVNKMISEEKCFDLLSNSFNLSFLRKCIETSLENLYVDFGA